ncbi:MAG TPA: HAMP domain-containing sensor histidine kinase, partial [Bryobacteraceae bacterium]|nr:HAMP domain-containing sensor histidine kinase [Bryobacteraceae bacterium]
MDVKKNRRREWLAWLFVAMLAALCGILGVLQYRWIGEVSRAERERLRDGLRESLRQLSEHFNREIAAACMALIPTRSQAEGGAEQAYALRYAKWRTTSRHNRLFGRIALAVPEGDAVVLRNLDLHRGVFEASEWPASWSTMKEWTHSRLSENAFRGTRPFSMKPDESNVFEFPFFARGPERFREDGPGGGPERGGGPRGDRPRELNWLIVELDLGYVREALLPEMVQKYLGEGGRVDYQVKVVHRRDPAYVLYLSEPEGSGIDSNADGAVSLFDIRNDRFRRGEGKRGKGGPPRWEEAGPGPSPGRGPGPDLGRWTMFVRHRAGSLETLVERARVRNLGVTAGILLLMIAASAALVRFTRRAQTLAELQMEFVAGVSHELRTPLTVIRTAAHNLSGGVVTTGSQMQRYGALIQKEAERLSDIVDQVLLFSNAKAGRAIRVRAVVAVDNLVYDALGQCRKIVEEARCEVETRIDPEVAPVFGDATALKHALQNLIGNAARYGNSG